MGVFDIGSAQSGGMQGAASMVANALVPRKTAAQTMNSMGGSTSVNANASAASAAPTAGGTITSNDFLTLLVSELKNQDPTQPTDPNSYITQLVGVNSLQQLIQINQGVTTLQTPTTTGNPVKPTA